MGLKMNAKAAALVMALLLLPGVSRARTIEQAIKSNEAYVVIRVIMFGNDYLRLTHAQQVAYVTGVIDGIYLAPVFDPVDRGPDDYSKIEKLHACLRGKTNVQVTAIVDKFLRDNPQRWHEPMNNLVYSAIVEACGLKY